MSNTQRILLLLLITMQILLILFFLYIGKSALGLDIFKDYSFGVWGWFKLTFLDSSLFN
ncbi:hypothetical protein [Psychromonas sp.]|uniref:hypothetical protein n=1 Tax=Psychromonas sp. TaxID=1884585 RepID=UPI0035687A55